MVPMLLPNYEHAYLSKNGWNHAVADDGRAACSLAGYHFINGTYKYQGPWDKATAKCSRCIQSLERNAK